MSYLNPLRLHFAGQFQASISTVNNEPVHYNNAIFKPNYQLLQTQDDMNGWWNPRGDGAWRLIGCQVTAAFLADGSPASDADQIRSYLIADSNSKTSAKLVDLDPQQQLVSEIWGLVVRITDGAGNTLVRGNFDPIGFMDIWARFPQGNGPEIASAIYQSVLTDLEWGDLSQSPFLQALKHAASDGLLSIKFNVDGYNGAFGDPGFTLGRIVGTIGPASAAEPRHFVAGRQLMTTTTSQGFYQPAGQINFCVAWVDQQRGKIYLDLGNALPINTSVGPPAPLGDLQLVCQASPELPIDTISQPTYTQLAWYSQTAGIVELPANRKLNQDELNTIANNPLAIVLSTAPSTPAVSENPNGLYIRADQIVFRLDPGQTAQLQLYATQFGQPYASAQVLTIRDASQLQQTEGTPLDQTYPPPTVATPADAICFPAVATTNNRGIAELPVTASNPGNPRDYIDGQIYGLRPFLADILVPTGNIAPMFNPCNCISLLVFEAFAPAQPLTWWGTNEHDSIQTIFQQYANLYPVMRDFLDLADYQSVCNNIFWLQMAFGLDIHDPNSMPVTRDLSPAKRQAILSWMNNPTEGTKWSPAAPATALAPTTGAVAAPAGPPKVGKETALKHRLSVTRSRG